MNHPMHKTWAALAAIVTLAAAVAGGSGAAAAPAEPTAFTCNNDTFFIYVVHDGDSDVSHVARLTSSADTATVTDFGTVPVSLNGLGYNPADDFLYAVTTFSADSPGVLYRIGSNGVSTALGVPAGHDSEISISGGTFITPDQFLMSGFTETGTELEVVDIPTNTVISTTEVPGFFADYATNPLDGKVYGFDQDAQRMAVIDPDGGTATLFGVTSGTDTVTGSDWFLNSGQMLLYGTPFDGGDQDRFYTGDPGVDASGTGALTEFATGPVASGTDGASCVTLTPVTTTTTAPADTTTTVAAEPAVATEATPAFTG